MSIVTKGLSAAGMLFSVILLLGAFMAGMAGVVYMSLSGDELKVPELVGKDFVESEKELAALGLKLKKRADRPSAEKINTIIEQLPKAGETVKTGQLILVVVSKAGLEADVPESLKQDIESDDTEKIEEMISEKPKKARTNSNTNKKTADTTRDTISNTATSSNSAVESPANKRDDADKKETATPTGERNIKETPAQPAKPQPSPQAKPPAKPPAQKPTPVDSRPRQAQRP